MKRFLLLTIVIVGVVWVARAQDQLLVCSFNIQFLGNSADRDNAGLAEMLKKFDIVVVQELLAPPYAGAFPDGTPFRPNAKAAAFFDCMENDGFKYRLSEEDTGPGIRIHLNSSATEWWVVFYKPEKVNIATELPSGFLSPIHAHNDDFDRVPYAFPFRTLDNKLDFVLISVHLEPGPGKVNKMRRQHELATIAKWVQAHNQKEKDFLILGDMNIENAAELKTAVPSSFESLNEQCKPTNTNVRSPKPYDHVLYEPAFTSKLLDSNYGFKVESLIDEMRPRWKQISEKKYPGDTTYNHNDFRRYYSDHNPVDFVIKPMSAGSNN